MTYEQVIPFKARSLQTILWSWSYNFCRNGVSSRTTEMQETQTGRPPKLSLEDQVLLALQYWREYRTTFTLDILPQSF